MDALILWAGSNAPEIIAAILGITGVWLTARQNIWCWPTGLANVILSAYVFFGAKLYADVILQAFYLVMTLYGWYMWKFGGKNHSGLKVGRIKPFMMLVLFIAGAAGTAFTGYVFSTFTDAALPWWDGGVAVWGVIATFVMARKYIENWAMWILIDLTCTGIYFYKELYAFSILYFIFAILAVYGLFQWTRDIRETQTT